MAAGNAERGHWDRRPSVLVGSATPDGLLGELFISGQPRWLGVLLASPASMNSPGLESQTCPCVESVDADTLGGEANVGLRAQ